MEDQIIYLQLIENGNIGNKMFQYSYIRSLQKLIPNSIITGCSIGEYGITSESVNLTGRILVIPDGHRHSMSNIADLLNRKIYDHLQFGGYVQRMEYYPDKNLLSSYFPSLNIIDKSFLGPGYITINVRGNEILRNTHPDYGPVPVSYFERISNHEKLTPVLMGQLGDNQYSKEILRRFSGCHIIESKSALEDLEIVRNSTNIVFGVSSFSWMASYISDSASRIHMPIRGFFNPKQRRDVDLIPINDQRYRFYEFPLEHWNASEQQMSSLIDNTVVFENISHESAKNLIQY